VCSGLILSGSEWFHVDSEWFRVVPSGSELVTCILSGSGLITYVEVFLSGVHVDSEWILCCSELILSMRGWWVC
jgi:hypothetical protein